MWLPCDCHTFKWDFSSDFRTLRLEGKWWAGSCKTTFEKGWVVQNPKCFEWLPSRQNHNTWEKRGLILQGMWMTVATGMFLIKFKMEFTSLDSKEGYYFGKCKVSVVSIAMENSSLWVKLKLGTCMGRDVTGVYTSCCTSFSGNWGTLWRLATVEASADLVSFDICHMPRWNVSSNICS